MRPARYHNSLTVISGIKHVTIFDPSQASTRPLPPCGARAPRTDRHPIQTPFLYPVVPWTPGGARERSEFIVNMSRNAVSPGCDTEPPGGCPRLPEAAPTQPPASVEGGGRRGFA